MKVLLDMDTGVDDSIALLYALRKPEIEIVGITTVCGNVEAWLAGENTQKILDLLDAPEIPVAVGSEQPLEKRWEGRVSFIHGDNGLGNVELPQSARTLCETEVSRFQMELAEQYAGELVVITLGPLTNIAKTIQRYPEFCKKVKQVVMMGGTVQMRGNVSPVSEANFACDPKACDLVFQSGMNILTVGLDVTMKVRLRRQHLDFLKRNKDEACDRAVAYMEEALRHYWQGNQNQNLCIDDCPLHDPLAVMVAAVPSLIRTETCKARIECRGTYCEGMVVRDLREHPIEADYIHFAMEVDECRALGELFSVFLKK